MGDDKLKVIAAELISKVRQSVTIDWTLRESARARIRVMVGASSSQQIRLPAGFTGRSREDGAGASRVTVCGLGLNPGQQAAAGGACSVEARAPRPQGECNALAWFARGL